MADHPGGGSSLQELSLFSKGGLGLGMWHLPGNACVSVRAGVHVCNMCAHVCVCPNGTGCKQGEGAWDV